MILVILSHTPVWVWALLALLLALGSSQARERRVAAGRLLALPMVMLGLGLWSMASGFAALPAAAALWLLALGASVAFSHGQRPPAGTRWLAAERRLLLPGSWVPMGLILGTFCLRYASNVGLALHPAWRGTPQVLLPLALVYGGSSGYFLGRALSLLRLARGASTDAEAATGHRALAASILRR